MNRPDLTQYALVLTPNQRLSSDLQLGQDEQRADAEHSWQAAPIFAFSSWLQGLWANAVAAGMEPCQSRFLLSSMEELECWRLALKAVTRRGNVPILLAEQSAAQHMMTANTHLANWLVDLEQAEIRQQFDLQEEAALFLEVREQFIFVCDEAKALPASFAISALAELARKSESSRVEITKLSQKDDVLLFGFAELTPAQQQLLNAFELSINNIDAASLNAAEISAKAHLQQSADAQSELRDSAEWAAQLATLKPEASIAVIVPDLQSRRAEVERVFAQVFNPNAALPDNARALHPFNLSAGQALADTPVVNSALSLLNLNRGSFLVSDLPRLLHSPHFACSQTNELSRLIELENRLRARRDKTLSTSSLLFEASYETGNPESGALTVRCSGLAAALRQFMAEPQAMHNRSFTEWMTVFARQLELFGWPGRRTLDSTEYQQFQHWLDAIEAAHGLAHIRFGVSGDVGVYDALSIVNSVMRETVFQAQSINNQVQVLGLLEGAGLSFDYTRLLDFAPPNWPSIARPSSFIPFGMQRQLRMPHCDAHRELEFSRSVLSDYLSNSKHLVLSFPAVRDDQPVKVSELIKECGITTVDQDIDQAAVKTPQALSDFEAAIEPFPDQSGPALSGQEILRVSSGLFQDEALCSFRAFARHRLGLQGQESVSVGLDPRERGILLHDSLEAVWRALGDSRQLNSLSDVELGRKIEAAIEIAMQAARKRLVARDSKRYLEVEAQRLQLVLQRWLAHEAERKPFKIYAQETVLDTLLLDRPARLRVDRIDELETGERILIEYKTGEVSESRLLSEPLLAPQLPLYLSLYDKVEEGAGGAAMCRVATEKSQWIGLGLAAEQQMPLQKRAPATDLSWAELGVEWRGKLNDLEQSFRQGHSSIKPVEPSKTCRYCDFASLCRYEIDAETNIKTTGQSDDH